MNANDYRQTMRYEYFIRTVFNCQQGNQHGANKNCMRNLMTMENGKTYAKHLGSFSKQFEIVKTYISKALTKLSIMKSYSTESKLFIDLNLKLKQSTSTQHLMEIVNIALNKIIDLKKK